MIRVLNSSAIYPGPTVASLEILNKLRVSCGMQLGLRAALANMGVRFGEACMGLRRVALVGRHALAK